MPVAFQVPHFYPILDTAVLAARNCPVILLAETLLAAGARILQYRHKDHWTQREYDEGAALARLCSEGSVLFVMNDRADYAKLLGAALHIGQDDLPPAAARRVVSDEVIGFSTHNRPQLKRAAEEPVEYVSVGPIFDTTSKLKPDPVLGVAGVRTLRPLTTKPLVAIGGITQTNAREVLDAGADAVAVISAIIPEKCDRKSLKRCAEEWLTLTA